MDSPFTRSSRPDTSSSRATSSSFKSLDVIRSFNTGSDLQSTQYPTGGEHVSESQYEQISRLYTPGGENASASQSGQRYQSEAVESQYVSASYEQISRLYTPGGEYASASQLGQRYQSEAVESQYFSASQQEQISRLYTPGGEYASASQLDQRYQSEAALSEYISASQYEQISQLYTTGGTYTSARQSEAALSEYISASQYEQISQLYTTGGTYTSARQSEAAPSEYLSQQPSSGLLQDVFASNRGVRSGQRNQAEASAYVSASQYEEIAQSYTTGGKYASASQLGQRYQSEAVESQYLSQQPSSGLLQDVFASNRGVRLRPTLTEGASSQRRGHVLPTVRVLSDGTTQPLDASATGSGRLAGSSHQSLGQPTRPISSQIGQRANRSVIWDFSSGAQQTEPIGRTEIGSGNLAGSSRPSLSQTSEQRTLGQQHTGPDQAGLSRQGDVSENNIKEAIDFIMYDKGLRDKTKMRNILSTKMLRNTSDAELALIYLKNNYSKIYSSSKYKCLEDVIHDFYE